MLRNLDSILLPLSLFKWGFCCQRAQSCSDPRVLLFTSKLAFPYTAERFLGICPLCFPVTRHSLTPGCEAPLSEGTGDAARFQLRLIIALWLFSEITGESHEEPCSLMQRVGLRIFHHCWQNRPILPAVSCESSALLGARGRGQVGNLARPGEQGLTQRTRVTAGKAPQEFKSSLLVLYYCSQSRNTAPN